jgi:molybdate transport system ATP-binding protein
MKDVDVTYQQVNVVDHLNWTVRRGERWALLGPNGAGKTTLLSLVLADNPQAYRNEIRLFGKPRGSGESIWQIKRRIGWVSPELHAFYDQAATCLDVVCSGYFDSVGLYRQVDETQQQIALGWLNALGLSELKARRFHSLSAGQQRVALLARALVKFPPLLVLDEPCQGLDDQRRAVFVGLVEQICSQTPVTLIFVTHYLEELPPAVNHRLRIEKGSVVECC